ncbi:MAG: MBL fold metallo-hydrolase [Deltaproteobacteria bacterium]|nr:MAG: MBL fold metallo-hydrolase [Deltaproteobacteria bacterium]
MSMDINEVDKVEILTLQDNYIDLTSGDSTDIVLRAMPVKDMEVKNSLLAEHGFSSIITVTKGDRSRSMLFDFGFSSHGAAFNADAMGLDLHDIEVSALSHGHLDHIGGFLELMKRVNRKGIEVVMHPEALRNPRYMKISEDLRVRLPSFTREMADDAEAELVETRQPRFLLDGDVLFLGEIPRTTDFEKSPDNMYYQKNGKELWDDLVDDTSIVANVKGKGLVVVSGCAHAGIINTLRHAKDVSGMDKVFVVMGGFHLGGPAMMPVIEPTIQGLKEMDPAYIIPTHCTGRYAIMRIENEMPDRFILNMVGTKLTFSA